MPSISESFAGASSCRIRTRKDVGRLEKTLSRNNAVRLCTRATEFFLDCYMPCRIPPKGGTQQPSKIVEMRALDERIRELCARAAAAEESEVEAIFAELQAALQEHLQFVRTMTALTLNRGSKKRGSSSSKAA